MPKWELEFAFFLKLSKRPREWRCGRKSGEREWRKWINCVSPLNPRCERHRSEFNCLLIGLRESRGLGSCYARVFYPKLKGRVANDRVKRRWGWRDIILVIKFPEYCPRATKCGVAFTSNGIFFCHQGRVLNGILVWACSNFTYCFQWAMVAPVNQPCKVASHIV